MSLQHSPFSQLFSAICQLKVGIIGDFALDVYYHKGIDTGEWSLETGKPVHYGRGIRTSLGGAGNVAANLYALGVSGIKVWGVTGPDIWGREMRHHLGQLEADPSGLMVQSQGWDTCAYIKPLLEKEKEDHRLDFGSNNQLAASTRDALWADLREHLPSMDALIINEQFIHPLLSGAFLEDLAELIRSFSGLYVMADLRSGKQVWPLPVKINTAELKRLLGLSVLVDEDTPACEAAVRLLVQKSGHPVLLTRGPYGLMYADQGQVLEEPGIRISGEIDPVGAGDTTLAAWVASQAAGASKTQSLQMANLAASVTIKKLRQTGTASAEEIHHAWANRFYRFNPPALHPASQRHLQGKVEVIDPAVLERNVPIKQVILDHDGTVSTLREGWQEIMEGFMMSQLLQPSLDAEERALLRKQIQTLIAQTTGQPTLVQMEGLVDMLRTRHFPAEEILAPESYKAQFAAALDARVGERIKDIRRGHYQPGDYMIYGVGAWMRALADKGVSLALASGTDEPSIIFESEVLGVKSFYRGQIWGAKPETPENAKFRAIRHFLQAGIPPAEMAIVGDGPAEMAEGRKAGLLCIGVASHEAKGKEINEDKRASLITAGAQLILPDFSDTQPLVEMMGLA